MEISSWRNTETFLAAFPPNTTHGNSKEKYYCNKFIHIVVALLEMEINAMLFEKTVIMPIMRNVFNVHTVNKYKQTKFIVNINIVQYSVQTVSSSSRV